MGALGGAVVTVETDGEAVEQRLRSGLLACPGCSGVLAGWGRARARQVRGLDGPVLVVPRRARCTGCGRTQVLLPVLLLVRRADTVAVIGAGLAVKAAGGGHRVIAAVLGRPVATVRGWLRRFAGRVEAVRVVSPVGVGRWPRTRCCPDRPGRGSRTRSPRSAPPRGRLRSGSGSARWRAGRPPRRCRRGGCWLRAGRT